MSPSRIVAVVLLLISTLATGMLVYQHFAGAAIPGCAPGGACAQAAASAWGKVPGLNIPVSILGLAYYIAVLIAYVQARGEVGMLRWMVRIGVLGSLFYMGVMFANISDYFCMYCLIGHVGHFGFWAVMEWTLRSRAVKEDSEQPSFPLAVGAGAFALIAIGLTLANAVHQRSVDASAQREFDESMSQIGAGNDRGFAGRYILGPQQAAARVVMFTDYQCPQCKRVKQEIVEILKQRGDVSFSIKHYPLDAACNRHVGRTMHANACWAARVAEAGGILGGEEGFWKVHDWIVERGGEFSDAVLTYALPRLGFRPNEFMEVVRSQQTLDRVRADIDEASALGAFGTPMVFVNGVEMRGLRTADAIEKAIERAVETSAGTGDATEDRPPTAFEKHIDDWRHGMQATIPPLSEDRTLGAADPRVVMNVWGDFHDSQVAQLHAAVKAVLSSRDDVQYNFRFFPLDKMCNEHAPNSSNPNGCAAAMAAEAAARLGGPDAYLAMLDWLFRMQGRFNEAGIRMAASEVGVDAEQLLQLMRSDEVVQAVMTDAAGAAVTNIRWAPHVYINGRFLPRWRLEGHDVLGAVIDEAAEMADEAD